MADTYKPRWDRAAYTGNPILDFSGGRYLIARDYRGSRVWRAFLNGQRTSYTGSKEECMKSVERAIESANQQN